MSTTPHAMFKKERKQIEKKVKEMLSIPSIEEYAKLVLDYDKILQKVLNSNDFKSEEEFNTFIDNHVELKPLSIKLEDLEANDKDILTYKELFERHQYISRF